MAAVLDGRAVSRPGPDRAWPRRAARSSPTCGSGHRTAPRPGRTRSGRGSPRRRRRGRPAARARPARHDRARHAAHAEPAAHDRRGQPARDGHLGDGVRHRDGVPAAGRTSSRGSNRRRAATARCSSTRGRCRRRCSRDHMPANVIMLGAAYQHGCLPVSATAIERAIELNGAAVEINRAAFRWGRACAIDPAAVARASAPPRIDGVHPRSAPARGRHAAAGRRRPAGGPGAPGGSPGRRPGRLSGRRATRGATLDDVLSVLAVERERCASAAGGSRAGDRGLRAGDAQADGLQGRVRGRAAAPRHLRARPPGGRVRPRRRGADPPAPAASCARWG